MVIGCMMAMNAADLLKLSLASLIGKVDELVVVDGGSIDDTKSVAEDFGATVIESKWPDNHSLQRQVWLDYALSRARSDTDAWAFVLDSDEVLVSGDPRQTITELRPLELDHALLPRKWLVNAMGRLSYISSHPHYPDHQLRLFRLQAGLRYTGKIHVVLHGLGRGRVVNAPTILHLDLLRAGWAQRKQKVTHYEQTQRGSGVPRFYLFERYGFTLEPLTIDASVEPFLIGIRAITTVSLTAGDLRGKSLLYRLTRVPLDILDWTRLKARRVPGRVSGASRRPLELIRRSLRQRG